MKISEKQLRNIVREELNSVLGEQSDDDLFVGLEKLRSLVHKMIIECINIKESLSKSVGDRDKRHIIGDIQIDLNNLRLELKHTSENIVGTKISGRTEFGVGNISKISGHTDLYSYFQTFKNIFNEYLDELNKEFPNRLKRIKGYIKSIDKFISEYEDMI